MARQTDKKLPDWQVIVSFAGQKGHHVTAPHRPPCALGRARCHSRLLVPPAEQASAPTSKADAASGLAIKPVAAWEIDKIPLGSVPGTIVLPPEARVAVTAPFAGAVVRVYVIAGEPVVRGQAFGLVRATEPEQIGGDLARALSAARLAEARAQRPEQLAAGGIITTARADEAKAEAEQARVSVAQFARMAALGEVAEDGAMTLRAPISGRVAQVAVETDG